MNALIRSVAVLAVCVAASLSAQTSTSVKLFTGKLLGADGKPLPVAHVHLTPANQPGVITEGAVGPDGSYALATSHSGAFLLRFTGVNHGSTFVPVLLTGSSTIAIDVQLARYKYADTIDRIIAIGDWNGFDFGTGRTMVKQPDGRYTVEVETTQDTLAYQLLGVTAENRSINGTSADRYSYDGGGDYRSVLRLQKGKTTIVFDPRQLDRRPSEQHITWREPASFAGRFADAYATTQRLSSEYFDSSAAARARKDSLLFDWRSGLRELTTRLAQNRDPLIEDELLLGLVRIASLGARPDSALLARAAREIRPTSPAWAFHQPYMAMQMFVLARNPNVSQRETMKDTAAANAALGYLDAMVAHHADRRVRAEALGFAVQMAMVSNQPERGNNYFLRLGAEYPEAPLLSFLRAQYAPDRVVRVGAPVPSFRFVALEDSTHSYTREAMLGKVYLLDFWATWCGPCMGDMPYLHATYDSLRTKGLEILSVSLDQQPDDVTKFRRGEWKMPWLHAFARGGFTNPTMRQFEIVFIPRMALVGRDGNILAVDADLRGEKILPTIRQALQRTQ
jgi:thiol-disulfide isomerase/thioredoxin